MDSDEKKDVISLVHLFVQPSALDKIGASPQWYKAMDKITKEPNFRYVARGEAIDDAGHLILLVGWTHGTAPSPAFLPTAQDPPPALAPIAPFLTQRPRVCTLRHSYAQEGGNMLTTSARGRMDNAMIEFMTVRGPAEKVEPALKAIEAALRKYRELRDGPRQSDTIYSDTWDGVHLLGLDDDVADKEDQRQDGDVCLALFLRWSSREGRDEFQDPALPDRSVDPGLQPYYPSNLWQESVAKPLQTLREQGVTIESWDYHKAKLATNKRGGQLVASPSDIWGS